MCVRIPFIFWLSFGVLAGLVPSGHAMAGAPPTRPADAPSPVSPSDLVAQLGDASYPRREQAAQRLCELGLAARPALLAGMKAADLEIRLRCHQLLVVIMRQDFEGRLQEFQEDLPQTSWDFPGWQQFLALVGDGPAQRALFAAMLREEIRLLQSLEEESVLQDQLSLRAGSLPLDFFSHLDGGKPVPVTTISALLLASLCTPAPVDAAVVSRFHSLLAQPRVWAEVRHSPVSIDLLRKWLDRCIVASQGSSATYYALLLMFRYDLRELAQQHCRRLLQASVEQPQSVTPHILQYALLGIGKYGSGEDLQQLEKFFANKSPCQRVRINTVEIQTEVRDVALLMALLLTGQDPRSFGFHHLHDDPITRFRNYSIGFTSQQQRDEAFASWHKWRASHEPPADDAPRSVQR